MKYTAEYWMSIALSEAKKAFEQDEIPVGAILVKDNELILSTHNQTNIKNNPLAHAEKIIVETIISRGVEYLYDYTLYCTLEPCMMCSGILINSRIGKIVYGCDDPKTGACGSIYNVPVDARFNHNPIIIRHIMVKECSQILKTFFADKR